jgi:PGF-pre-PGF domain-containing protein
LRKAETRLQWIVAAFLTVVLLSSVSFIQVYSQIRKATQLTLSPETFTVASGQNITLTAKLASDGQPLAGKQIVFAASLGSVNPNVAVTNEEGFALTVYTAPVVSVRTNVTVTASFLGDLEYEGSIALSKGIIEVGLPTASITGASFAVPETLKDDVSSYRDAIPEDVLRLLPISLPSESFILATPGDLYLVFADQSDKGLANVEGWMLPQNITLAGISMRVIAAKSVIFEKEGAPATISEILANPDDYEFKLAKISADRRQVSMLYDPDEPPYIEFPTTVGYLVEKPVEPLNVLGMMLDKAGDFAFKLDEQFIKGFLKAEENQSLWLFNFEYEYWYDAPTVTNGIIIPTNHPIFRLINQSMPVTGKFASLGGRVVLYDVKTDITYEQVSSVAQLKANSSNYLGKIVGITANCYGGYISIQEVIRECAGENTVVDARLEGLTVWNEVSVPPKREELLLAAGISSFHQDKQFENVTGVLELIGKVASTRQISQSLPEDVALVICWTRKVGEIDFEKLARQVKDEIRGSVGELYWALQDIYPYKVQPSIPYKVPSKVFSPKAPIFVENPREVPEICVEKNFTINIAVAAPEAPIKLNITNSIVSNISITLKETVRNVTIFFEKLVEKPPDVPEPPGLVYAYHEISINIPEGAIKEANITFWVLKEWLATHKVSVESVVMLRYHAGEWVNLQTRVIGENATHYKFIAETPGFSTFAIIPEFTSALIFILMLTTTLTMALWKIKRKRLTS